MTEAGIQQAGSRASAEVAARSSILSGNCSRLLAICLGCEIGQDLDNTVCSQPTIVEIRALAHAAMNSKRNGDLS